jgi:hypothetical protein
VQRLVGLVLLICGACGERGGAPPCESIGMNFVAIARRDLDAAKLDDETRRLILDQLPVMRDRLVNSCKDNAWEPAVRSCMAGATDHAIFEQCEVALTTAQRNALERGDDEARQRDER